MHGTGETLAKIRNIAGMGQINKNGRLIQDVSVRFVLVEGELESSAMRYQLLDLKIVARTYFRPFDSVTSYCPHGCSEPMPFPDGPVKVRTSRNWY